VQTAEIAALDSRREGRQRVLDPVARVSEVLFGLIMALTFTGTLSAATADRAEVRTLLIGVIGCNIAWGLVDAVMYLVRTATDRGRQLTLVHAVRAAPDAERGRALVRRELLAALPRVTTEAQVEAIRERLLALDAVPGKVELDGRDAMAALGIFFIVVLSTFPVVLPFAFLADADVAKWVSRGLALAMLFFGGLALGKYAGYGSWKAGAFMAVLGSALTVAIVALGG
jgi:hypothetical protein